MLNKRRIHALGVLLVLSCGAALAAGSYQRTRDTGVLVWNEQPRAGQEVTWSGRKDRAGYATGYGTLTWFAPDRAIESGSNIPSRHHMVVVARLSGKMEQGKFIDRNNKRETKTPAPARAERTPSLRAPSNPKTTPSSSPTASSPPSASASPSATAPADKSLNSLTRPPSSLQLSSPAQTSPTPEVSVPPYP